jgi:ribonuclease BN (tRNA processing enzyme)
VFADSPNLLSVPTLVVECTFYCDATRDKAKQLEHIHIADLAKCLKGSFTGSELVLTHHSPRYGVDYMLEGVRKHFSDADFAVTLWI